VRKPPRRYDAPERSMPGARFVSSPISLSGPRDAPRYDIVLEGVEQAGASFEARVFLNNPQADASTPLTRDAGYVGSFHVYGYGHERQPDHPRPGEASLPMKRRVAATDAVRAAVAAGPTMTVTVVAVMPPGVADRFPDPLPIRAVEIVALPD
jgi:hypothetical protein